MWRLKWLTSPKHVSILQCETSYFQDFFNKRHFIDTFKVLFVKKKFGANVIVQILLISTFLYTFQRGINFLKKFFRSLKFCFKSFVNLNNFYPKHFSCLRHFKNLQILTCPKPNCGLFINRKPLRITTIYFKNIQLDLCFNLIGLDFCKYP